MDLPIYELKIQEELDDNAEVSFIALVDKPAIKKDFVVFSNEEFIEPSKGERKDKFLPRCISYVINEGKESEQAAAICNSIWEQHFAEDSYTDYPESAKNAAERGIKLNEKLGNKCATQVGKVRAQQIMNGEALSKETIKRTYSYLSRAAAYYNPDDTEACGTISYLLWGGESMLRWCESKMNNEDFAGLKVSFDYDDTLSTARGKDLAQKEKDQNNTLYIISARQDKEGMLSVAESLGIPESRVYATGSNKAKVEKIKELGIDKHYDNNADVISELGSVGHKFNFMGFAIQSEDKHIISGPLMLADIPIYRNNSKFGEHYVKFSPETIKDIAIKFSKKGYQQNVNLMHDSNMQLDGLVMFESFIVDKERGIMPMAGFEDAKDGSWFGSFYVENEQAWKLIKEGKVKGFSVEGFFDYALPENRQKSYAEQKLAELAELLKVPISHK